MAGDLVVSQPISTPRQPFLECIQPLAYLTERNGTAGYSHTDARGRGVRICVIRVALRPVVRAVL